MSMSRLVCRCELALTRHNRVNSETAPIDTELTGYRGIRGAILSVKLLLDRPWWFPGGKPATGSAV